ncbi:hypothetical protein [Paraburkholderia bonniea]|uniref:hypothetical protein n=1 Tax=Paraburkholderia bonniea TaxID=2152891 RepID=UPI001290EA57|nr:hypothetical protein [Paraburkholderia bonniea]
MTTFPHPATSAVALATAHEKFSQKMSANLRRAQEKSALLAQSGDPKLLEAARTLASFADRLTSSFNAIPPFSPWHLFEWLGQINQISLGLLDDAMLQQLSAHQIIHYEKDVSLRQQDNAHEIIASLPQPLQATISQHFARLQMMGCISRIDFDALETYVLTQAKRYVHEINQAYPLRTLDGVPLNVARVDANSLPDAYLTPATLAQLNATFSEATPASERLALCTQHLVCRRLQNTDLRPEDPPSLAGQNGVFAARDFATHELVGAYTGYLITRSNTWCVQSRSYSFSCKDKHSPGAISEFTEIVGDGIISRVNSLFTKDPQGQLVQAPDGYNTAIYGVRLLLQDGTSIMQPCYFTEQPVQQGEEFRANYGYTDAAVQIAIR